MSAGTGTPRVLIAAENASVRFGGEAILPYHYFRLLRARGVDAHLIVHARCQAELQTLFPEDRERLHFVVDQPLQKLFFKLGRALPRRLDEATLGLANQMLTQYAERSVIQRLAGTSTAGCVLHQPIPVSPRTPSMLHGLGIPLVVGPLNGGMEYPQAFLRQESLPSRIAIGIARSFTDFGNAIFPGKRLAEVVLVANQRTHDALPSGLRGRVQHLAENGVDLARWQPMPRTMADGPRFLFVGRLVDWKALDLALEALVRVEGASLDIIGDGPMREPWQQRARELGLADRVQFHGWLSQDACATHLARACALVLPSLFECGGAVVLEAMAMQRPVIATAWGGPLDYLDATCGILVPPTSREAVITGFADAMRRLAASPELCTSMGTAGRSRVLKHFDWERKIDAILDVYDSTLTN
jgi:glycosyltransferase involved in cell wall biosynthesis